MTGVISCQLVVFLTASLCIKQSNGRLWLETKCESDRLGTYWKNVILTLICSQLKFVITVAFTLTSVDSANILGLFQTPFVSHWLMPSVLLEELVSRGHNVTVLSPFPLKSPPPNYHDLSLERVAQMFELPLPILQGLTVSSFVPMMLKNTLDSCRSMYEHSDFRDHVKTLMCGKYDVILVEVI